jgi:hypothetical protein
VAHSRSGFTTHQQILRQRNPDFANFAIQPFVKPAFVPEGLFLVCPSSAQNCRQAFVELPFAAIFLQER